MLQSPESTQRWSSWACQYMVCYAIEADGHTYLLEGIPISHGPGAAIPSLNATECVEAQCQPAMLCDGRYVTRT